MNRYRIAVVASYGPDVDLFGIFGQMAHEAGGTPRIGTSGEGWTLEEDVRILPIRRNLTVVYEANGRGEDEARQAALALFRLESGRVGLPAPETVIANLE